MPGGALEKQRAQRKEFVNSIAIKAGDLLGVLTVQSAVARKTALPAPMVEKDGITEFPWDDVGKVKALLGALTGLLENFLGFVVAENIISACYHRTITHVGNDAAPTLLALVPEQYLEKERVLLLSREELEQKVFDKIAQLRKINESLEREVAERTKELAETNERLKVQNIALANANSRLTALDEMKSEFVSIAAHQLRTPLSAVKWALRLVLDGDAGKISKAQENLLEKGYVNNERMIVLIDDLLDVHRIETGKEIYTFEKIHVEDAIKNAIDVIAHRFNEKQIPVIFNAPAQSLKRINADEEKIRTIIENLLDNALKYTEHGSVTVSAEERERGVEIRIVDTGVGIAPKDAPRIFSKFFRAGNAVRMDTGGSGLGLFIAKSIVERHEGTITFTSEQGKGTTFIIFLPFAQKKM